MDNLLSRPHSVLLYGPPGSGKTWSLRTIPPTSPTYIIFTDIHGPGSLARAFDPPGIPPHIHYTVIDLSSDFNNLLTGLKLALLPQAGPKSSFGETAGQQTHLKFVSTLQDFRCDCHKKSHGPISSFPPEATVVLDNMTGITDTILLALGGWTGALTLADWGRAAVVSLNVITTFRIGVKGLFICIAHATAEVDELQKDTKIITPDFVGAKLPTRIAKYFGDTIYARRHGMSFQWTTAATGAQTVPRRLPLAAQLEPSFLPFFTSDEQKESNK